MRPVKIDSLPEEILADIFLYRTRDTSGRRHSITMLLNIAHTNRALRRAALSSPHLWSFLFITIGYSEYIDKNKRPELIAKDEGLLNLFQLWVERSDNMPLNYFIVVRERTRTTDDLLKLLFWEKYRWQSIELLSPRGLRFFGTSIWS